ncbi:MAG TPA: tetratricopeptide repeat protein, partial [Polyangiaceae bacterium]
MRFRIVAACGLAGVMLGSPRASYAQQPGSAGAAHVADDPDSESSYLRAVAAQKRAKGVNDASVAEALIDLAIFYDAHGKMDLEIAALREAQGVFERVPQVDRNHYGGCLNRLATLLVDRDDFDGAEPLFVAAAAQYDRITGPKSVGAAFARANAGMILERQRDFRGAESLLEAARAKFEATVGPNDPQIAVALNHLAALYGAHDAVRAEATYRQLIAVHEHDGDAVALAVAVNDLATLHTNQGQWLLAEQELKRALNILETSKQIESAPGVKILTTFATLELKRGDFRSARSMAERAEAIAEAKLEPNNAERGYAALILAGIYKAAGEYRRAEALYLRAE